MQSPIQLKKTKLLFLIPMVPACFALLTELRAVSPAPDGAYPGFNTAEGQSALAQAAPGVWNTAIGAFTLSADVTGGNANTAVGLNALRHNTTGDFNTAVGVNALLSATTGSNNTALGGQALKFNTTGSGNTAVGLNALVDNTTGNANAAFGQGALASNNSSDNAAFGFQALSRNTSGFSNTAMGAGALFFNTFGIANTAIGNSALFGSNGDFNTAIGIETLVENNGDNNTATGSFALLANRTGGSNTATGFEALTVNQTGSSNTANGADALGLNRGGNNNTACGALALFRNDGSNNTALGTNAGSNLITGNGNVCIGFNVLGVAGESNTTRIRNIYGSVASARAVYVNSDNKIGTVSSSRRYKEEIKPIDKASETLFALNPVTFRYKKEVDPARALSFGLIAEEVAAIDPNLITRDEKGNPQTVRYDAVNAMLLNEFLKEHRKVEQLTKDFETKLAQQQKQIEALTAGLQKVNAQLELSKSASQTVVDNQ